MAASTVSIQFSGLRCIGKESATCQKSVAVSARVNRTPVVVSAQSGSSNQSQNADVSISNLVASVSTSAPAAQPPLPAFVALGALLGATGYAAFSKVTAKEPEAVASSVVSNGATVSPFNKRAAPGALATISYYFPNAMQDESFVSAVAQELFNLGFSRENCIALVNTCRDEVCRPLATYVDQTFGLSFNVAGLGGLINCGKTGMKAGMSHSPEFPCDRDGKPRERYVFFAFPHVSIGESGEVGSLLRRGRGKPSSACGALIAIKNDAKTAGEIVDDDEDAEYITLKRKVLSQPVCKDCGPAGPSLVDVTKAALQVITDDLELLISKTVNPETSDYAVITGVQIHSGCQVSGEPFRLDRTVDYVAPGTMYAVIRGEKHILHCEVNQITAIKSVSADLVTA